MTFINKINNEENNEDNNKDNNKLVLEKYNLRWYNFFTWWILIWFIFYKIRLVKYSPFYAYIFILSFISILLPYQVYILLKNIKKKNIKNIPYRNYLFFMGFIMIVLLTDILPIFFCENKIDKGSVLLFLGLLLSYMIFMDEKKISVLRHYFELELKIFLKNYTNEDIFKNIQYFLGN